MPLVLLLHLVLLAPSAMAQDAPPSVEEQRKILSTAVRAEIDGATAVLEALDLAVTEVPVPPPGPVRTARAEAQEALAAAVSYQENGRWVLAYQAAHDAASLLERPMVFILQQGDPPEALLQAAQLQAGHVKAQIDLAPGATEAAQHAYDEAKRLWAVGRYQESRDKLLVARGLVMAAFQPWL